ncbi:DUF3077 domain-containing protein [Pseudomonas sp. SWRI59]|jgi:Protein of unknown function (DUF3077).|uniref:DUF3077 domain-containing protein n=1 Tax=Pseudomonas capeferrum TaxID=1495066 RepID=A0ABY7RFQ0_9PSED|nr:MULTISPECIES: DUF3077 domain-containing protein [Pseudomonas]KEY88341.1 hypothetical protein PC358_04235 [Pseudomonas capeferrum]KGI91665.1 hypothetical protein MD26_19290 [Pseudomonas sp. H2]MBC3483584.1 DUF3077 domain-containing protein [Pseudomonas sp. SWRI77]MBC3502948.1 DUF3077 domain-containing protein [Pseudomonas sp. SWRI59]MBC3509249.1 DUF3077 domain-containing protein [Pseudomonas sp. SWRI68]
MADEPKPLTTAGLATFLDVGNPSLNLLRVQPGIPIDVAYEQVSVLLGYIKHLVREGDMDDDHKLLGAADYLSVLAKALMDDIELAKNRLH